MHEWSRLTRRHSRRILVPCGQSEGGAFTLTFEIKRKILGENTARLYGIDI